MSGGLPRSHKMLVCRSGFSRRGGRADLRRGGRGLTFARCSACDVGFGRGSNPAMSAAAGPRSSCSARATSSSRRRKRASAASPPAQQSAGKHEHQGARGASVSL